MTESPAPFPTLGDLRAAHLAFMDDKTRDAAAIRGFLGRARASGAHTETAHERREAQRILDFWSAELLGSRDLTAEDFNPAILDPFGEEAAGDRADAATDLAGRAEAARELIRLSALARQWKTSGEAPGYLLQGDALLAAARFTDRDPDIAAFVTASNRHEQATIAQQARRRQAVITILALLLVAATALAVISWYQWQAAERARTGLANANEVLSLEKAELQLTIERSRADAQSSQTRIDALISENARLAAALNEGAKATGVETEDLPPDLKATVENALPETSAVISAAQEAGGYSGYDPAFLGLDLPMPALGEALRPSAALGGAPLDYPNASLVMNAARRQPFFAAEMVDRKARLSLRRVPGAFSFDPRLPQEQQADPAWFLGPDIDRGHLIPRNGITWGPVFEGDLKAAALRLNGIVDTYANASPQFGWFNRGIWSRLENWALSGHNPSADRIVIFTGPILTEKDPAPYGTQVPSGFWKVVVSRRNGSAGLIVDPFILMQTDTLPATFLPEAHRTSLEEIERQTGLIFPAILFGIEAGGEMPPDLSPGEALAARLGDLLTADRDTSGSILDALAAAFAPGGFVPEEQTALAAALVALADETLPTTANPAIRDNLLTALALVPPDRWADPAWQTIRARARHAVASLPAALGGIAALPEGLPAALAILPPPEHEVTIRFSLTPRAEAEALAVYLTGLGWRVGAAERTGSGPEQSVIAFTDADQGAGSMLAADLASAGYPAKATAPEKPSAGRIDIRLP
ncbi:DNA/RNA non-specific endonuclease [Frigidibacter sp. RF13]|uniref:DNA/RNA non-specific endonuclease n=1 Tax=Frigidibacter sp. RF13 TaxID=2997340 RepID=UPI00226F8523|nr:DNA/RNA non-specific endonuclease [Frigidibacter sp. RF13]MCY1125527.1 DNA/RNA non-specific endonuclease [Frigidibacter sp. RF13]